VIDVGKDFNPMEEIVDYVMNVLKKHKKIIIGIEI